MVIPLLIGALVGLTALAVARVAYEAGRLAELRRQRDGLEQMIRRSRERETELAELHAEATDWRLSGWDGRRIDA